MIQRRDREISQSVEIEGRRDRETERGRDGETERNGVVGKIYLSVPPSLCPSVSLPLCLFLFFWAIPLIAKAQTGGITGRVIAEDGGGLSNVNVSAHPAYAGRRNAGSPLSTTTDEEGNFKFTELTPRAYSIYVRETKGYVRPYIPGSGATYYRIGDHAVITMIRGGVITGRVATANGEPMVGAQVIATMTRDVEGNPLKRSYWGRVRITDDRGVYRLYGLAPGTYVVSVRSNLSIRRISPYDGDTPIYYPSSTRDTAAEVAVASGGEVAGIDIRYRGERGHIVSGAVSGAGEGSQQSVSLHNAATGSYFGSAQIRPGEAANSFAIRGVSDGEYEVVANVYGRSDEADNFVSLPRRVTVRGADVGGIELKVAPLASIAGKIVVENQSESCETKRKLSIEEVIVSLRRNEKTSWAIYQGYVNEIAPNDKGEFVIRHIVPGRYFTQLRLPAEYWYVKSISRTPSASSGADAKRPSAGPDLAQSGVALKTGEKLSGLTLMIAGGSASLSGKVIAAKEGARLPPRIRLHLAPVEATSANDPLRYAEAIARGDGAFTFNNIAPGKYWLIARATPDDEPIDYPPTPVAWDADERAKLRREAEASKGEIELKPCQRVTEQIVKFAK
jgi:Carboxypeptidase regulatory-like domain